MFGTLAMTSGAASLLWILAVALVIGGVVAIVRGSLLIGVAMIVFGLLVGPGGVSILR
jgi:hypothetical protein